MIKTYSNVRLSTLLLVFLLISFVSYSQPGGGNPGGGGQNSPISGLEILLGSGIILGLRKLVSNKKDK